MGTSIRGQAAVGGSMRLTDDDLVGNAVLRGGHFSWALIECCQDV